MVDTRRGKLRSAVTLRSALSLLLALAFMAALLPAGILLDRWLARELELRADRDLAAAPRVLAARDAALHDAMMMHAKELAHDPAITGALLSQDRAQAMAVLEPIVRAYNYAGVLLGGNGDVWLGPAGSATLADATRAGNMPVEVVADRTGLHLVSLAPVIVSDEWLGAVGVTIPLDAAAAGVLAGLTHSDLVVLVGADGRWTATPGDSAVGAAVARATNWSALRQEVRELRIGRTRYLARAAPLGGATAVFVQDLARELAMLQMLRRVVSIAGLAALIVALLLGYILAGLLVRPVRQLAAAADRISAGDFTAPLPRSSLREVVRVSSAFGEMRRTLAARLDELRSANRMLEERQARLSVLQSELIKRERIATSARMAVELAHEIRNPVANVRNSLELLERRLAKDPEAREFASMAIDELLRMHELAERMLQLNRPRDLEAGTCDALAVAREVIALTEAGHERTRPSVHLMAAGEIAVAVPADTLKQVLLNLIQNARDAKPNGLVMEIAMHQTDGDVLITVCDNGPGIPTALRERVFDPFFTTRAQAGGIGLGLFLVEGMVRGHGGSVTLLDRAEPGTCFQLRVPAAPLPARAERRPPTTAGITES